MNREENKISNPMKGSAPGVAIQAISDFIAFKYIPNGDRNQSEAQLKYRFRIVNCN